jgi:hypothetical protein
MERELALIPQILLPNLVGVLRNPISSPSEGLGQGNKSALTSPPSEGNYQTPTRLVRRSYVVVVEILIISHNIGSTEIRD